MIQIASTVYREMAGYCFAQLPQEACGLLSAREGIVRTCWPIINQQQSNTSFAMDEAEVDSVLSEMERSGEQLAAIFHSHPTASARPSPFDIEQIVYPCSYIILSLAHQRTRIRSYVPLNKTLIPERILLIH